MQGLCISPESSNHKAKLSMQPCDDSASTPKTNLWTWNSETKLIKYADTGALVGNFGGYVRAVLQNK